MFQHPYGLALELNKNRTPMIRTTNEQNIGKNA